jgi:membrane fusion protein (multidrug efflux system)
VQRSAQGDRVKVVATDGKVTDRAVRLGPARDGQWVVLEGLATGEQVIVDGFQKLQGDRPVTAVPWRPPVTTVPGAAAPSPAAGS